MISDKSKAICVLAEEMDLLLEESQAVYVEMNNIVQLHALKMRACSNRQEVIINKLAALQDTLARIQNGL